MKTAQLEENDKPIKLTVLVLDPFEAKHVAIAFKEYAERNKRKKKIQKLADELELASMFY